MASAKLHPAPSSIATPGLRWSPDKGFASRPERVAVEAPLSVEIAYARGRHEVLRLVAMTMRTPGDDEDLALGFLHSEGLVGGTGDLRRSEALAVNSRGEEVDTLRLHLARAPDANLARISRGVLTASACGLCGRPGLEGLPLGPRGGLGPGETHPSGGAASEEPRFRPELLASLPERLRRRQPLFDETGGCHGAGLFGAAGEALLVREDVGRHNAVDKVVGAALRGSLSLRGLILVVSGRASFELVQKAALAGAGALVAVGAPSSLAVGLAARSGLVLAGFTREGRFNAYAGAARLAQ